MFLILFRNILCSQQMFPSLRTQGNIMSNNVSATMFPCLSLPLAIVMPFGRLSVESEEVRKQKVNWQSYVQ